MEHALALAVVSFLAYSAAGWLHETIYALVTERRLRNPGLLRGPVLPIYGAGAVAAVVLLTPIATDPLLVFAGAVAVTTVVEYLGAVLLERLLGLRLWDYSDRWGNLHGRVCAVNSLGFGLLATVVVYLVDPALHTALVALPAGVAEGIATAGLVLVVLDLALVVRRRRAERRAARRLAGERRASVA